MIGIRTRRPDLFIVGAPKCGTTTMYRMLAQHPEIFMSRVKEPHFFSTDLPYANAIRDQRAYDGLFSGARGMRVGEASASYLYSRVAAERLKAFSPAARIIIMLRRPVDMLYSLHGQYVVGGLQPITDFGAALRAETEAGGRAESRYPIPYWGAARYVAQVERYIEHFGWPAVQVVIFDDLVRDASSVCRDVLRFLEVDDSFRPRPVRANPSRTVRSAKLRDVTARLKPPKGLRPNPARRALFRGLSFINRRYEARPPMGPGLKSALTARFAPEVEQLGQLLGRDLSHWSVG